MNAETFVFMQVFIFCCFYVEVYREGLFHTEMDA